MWLRNGKKNVGIASSIGRRIWPCGRHVGLRFGGGDLEGATSGTDIRDANLFGIDTI